MVADFWDALRGPKRCSKTSRRAIEDAPAERHKPLAQLFDRVWQTTAPSSPVEPRTPFARYFATVADIQAPKEIPHRDQLDVA
jgi:hypothetical protein